MNVLTSNSQETQTQLAMHAAAAEGESEWRPWLVRVRASSNTASAVLHWAPEFGGRNGFPPPENNELVLFITTGCTDTVPFQLKPNTPF